MKRAAVVTFFTLGWMVNIGLTYVFNAIRLLRGVSAVTPVTADVGIEIAAQRVRAETRTKVRAFLNSLGT